MDDPRILALVLVMVVAVCTAGLTLRSIRLRYASLVGFALAMLASGGAWIEALGQPKPISYDLMCRPTADTAKVVAGQVREPADILVWLDVPGCGPRLYSLPYTTQDAEAMSGFERQRKAGKAGAGSMVMRLEPSLDHEEPKFYAAPQPALPPKEVS